MSLNSFTAGDKVLFVAPATVDQAAFIQVKNSVQEQVGSNGQTAFEVFERVSEGKAIVSF